MRTYKTLDTHVKCQGREYAPYTEVEVGAHEYQIWDELVRLKAAELIHDPASDPDPGEDVEAPDVKAKLEKAVEQLEEAEVMMDQALAEAEAKEPDLEAALAEAELAAPEAPDLSETLEKANAAKKRKRSGKKGD